MGKSVGMIVLCRKKFLKKFDEAAKDANYPTRSEAVRDLMRKLIEERGKEA